MCAICGCGGGLIKGRASRSLRKAGEVARFRLHQHAHEIVTETANGHDDYFTPEDGTCHARFPHLSPGETTSHSTKPASGQVAGYLPEGEETNERLRECHVNEARLVKVERDILAKNNNYAGVNRHYLAERGIFSLNLVSSPGSGKTTLLVKTIAALNVPLAVIEGDQQTENDAMRIRAAGAPAIQINTGRGCHLDAKMVGHAMEQLDLQDDSLLLIENVGNLVCPASFDLGEAHKVVILSVTEGEDKPLKYPDMFRAADLMLLNKCDLLSYLEFDADLAISYARRINPDLQVIRISATSGIGMPAWLAWITAGCTQAAKQRVTIAQ